MPYTATPIRHTHETYHILANFRGENGSEPYADLTAVGNTLYGTTWTGGPHGWGTVFSVGMTGGEHVLYAFNPRRRGAVKPEAGLVEVNGTLYGTTYTGGPNHRSGGYACGTVFSITPSGGYKNLFDFDCASAGGNPEADLINVNGTLYGTTYDGGTYGGGTVFSISTSGSEHVIYSFGASKTDGIAPRAGLLDVNGVLYGTTSWGGSSTNCGRGCGTVFSVGISGGETVLHSFGSSGDGQEPLAGLIDVGGTLYGTTNGGGAYGKGTVFSVSTSGDETVLHSFGYGSDGEYPSAAMLDANGTLYGTTMGGGQYVEQSGGGGGTIFSISTSGGEQIVHSFGKGDDGSFPQAALIDVSGTLYGTTTWGGRGSRKGDFGIVFSLKV
jgi:uncharacterized repeat protein (TIGR03803 family)